MPVREKKGGGEEDGLWFQILHCYGCFSNNTMAVKELTKTQDQKPSSFENETRLETKLI